MPTVAAALMSLVVAGGSETVAPTVQTQDTRVTSLFVVCQGLDHGAIGARERRRSSSFSPLVIVASAEALASLTKMAIKKTTTRLRLH